VTAFAVDYAAGFASSFFAALAAIATALVMIATALAIPAFVPGPLSLHL